MEIFPSVPVYLYAPGVNWLNISELTVAGIYAS